MFQGQDGGFPFLAHRTASIGSSSFRLLALPPSLGRLQGRGLCWLPCCSKIRQEGFSFFSCRSWWMRWIWNGFRWMSKWLGLAAWVNCYVAVIFDIGEWSFLDRLLSSCANGWSLSLVEVDLHKSLDVVLCWRRDHIDVDEAVSLRSSERKSLQGTKWGGLILIEAEPEIIVAVLGAGVRVFQKILGAPSSDLAKLGKWTVLSHYNGYC